MKNWRDENGKCRLSHDLVNQLTVILICCDMLKDEPAEQAENSRRLSPIRTAARSIAQELSRHDCGYEEMVPARTEAKAQLLS